VYKRRLKIEIILKNKCIKQDGRMNTSQSSKNLKKRAQALVEFALIVPVLMMLLYGVLETGRLLFIYASSVTAARQAVRYATALGTNSGGIPYYNDCAGIQTAVNKVGFLNTFQPVSITYDQGLDGSGNPIPFTAPPASLPANPVCGSFTPSGNSDRILIEVTTEYKPIISLLPIKPFTIKSSSERTILSEIEVSVTPTPIPNQAILQLTATSNPTVLEYTMVGQAFAFTYKVKNAYTVDNITNVALSRTVNGVPQAIVCTPPTLTPGLEYTCPFNSSEPSHIYQIQPSDIGIGKTVTIVVTATGYPSKFAGPITFVLAYKESPSLYLTRSADPLPSNVPVGTNIHYKYTISNNGNVDVYNLTVTDNKTTVDCSSATNPLAPGGVTYCYADYPITVTDTNAGSVTNQATAHGIFNATVIDSNNNTPTSLTVTIPQQPALSLVKSSTTTVAAAAGITIPYKYTITNTGNVDLTNLSVTDDKIVSPNSVSCSGAPSTIHPGDSGQWCSSTYVSKAADITAGQIVNTARAAAKFGSTTIYSNYSSFTVYTTLLVVQVIPTPTSITLPNQAISYQYKLVNNSGGTINSINLTYSKGSAPSGCPTSLAAWATATCTTNGSYTVTQDDYDKGISIVNTAQATSSVGNSNSYTATIPITQSSPALTLTITSNPSQPTLPAITLPAGTVVTFTYRIKNTGNVTLTASSSAITPSISPHTFTSSCAGDLVPNAEKPCTGTYTVTATDIDLGAITNTVTATASTKYNTQTAPTATDVEKVITFLGPRYKLVVTQEKTNVYPNNPTLKYTYTYTNTGTVTLSRPTSVSSTVTSTLLIAGTGGTDTTTTLTADCSSAPLTFDPGSSIQCFATYSQPQATGSSTLVNGSFTTAIAENPASTIAPTSVTAKAYTCTSSNFSAGPLVQGTGGDKNKITWAITNTIGVNVPLSSISINWANSGSSGSQWSLTGLTVNNSSSVTLVPALPDTAAPYTSSTGVLTGSSSGASVTTITFTFSKNDPTNILASITIDSPYGCTRSKP
jgi:hypothetical protein